MRDVPNIDRRSVLKGRVHVPHHISSAVVVALPARRDEIGGRLAAMPGVEVHAGDGSRIVVTIEGPSSGMLGETLTTISMMDGVISANMVFEHIEQGEDLEP
ncbi:chaperone NapD [Mesorhizobium sp. LHD-90]|uniref:chaperone NapD n=1 Tax=Mesorhizobium sp. LHD-90 TaxID=3071414 RepID=UPI0027E06316|nr:chaperone NapD [Mesorhizobium sp. LHD-90]MDQ6435253.1 chaperone NapD [Mesorhizobium sp. LHD-90]